MGKTNLLPHQQRALSTLDQQDTFLIVPCDKNLGPAIIERHDYLKIAMRDDLNDTTSYKLLTRVKSNDSQQLKKTVAWLKTHHKKSHEDGTNIHQGKTRQNKVPYARPYLTLIAHKLKPGQTVDKLKNRHIVSCPGSILHGLGLWVDRKLQEVAKSTIS